MSSATNIELHSTFGVRDTLSSLKEEISRLEREEREQKMQTGIFSASSTTTTPATTHASSVVSSSHYFVSSATDPSLHANSLSTLQKADAEAVVRADEARAVLMRSAMRELVDANVVSTQSEREARAAVAVTGSAAPPAASVPPSCEQQHATEEEEAMSTMEDVARAERLREQAKEARRIEVAAHIRTDVHALAARMALEKEEEKLAEDLALSERRRQWVTVVEALSAGEQAERRAIEAEWFLIGFYVGGGGGSTAAAAGNGNASEPTNWFDLSCTSTFAFENYPQQSYQQQQQSFLILPFYARVATEALLAPPMKQKALLESTRYASARRAMQQYLARNCFRMSAVSASSASTPRPPLPLTVNNDDAAADAVRDLSYTISIAEAYFLCAVTAEEKTQNRIKKTAETRRASEWAASEGNMLSDLDALLKTEASSIVKQREFKRNQQLARYGGVLRKDILGNTIDINEPDTSLLPPTATPSLPCQDGDPNDPFNAFHFARAAALSHGYGVNNKTHIVPYSQRNQQYHYTQNEDAEAGGGGAVPDKDLSGGGVMMVAGGDKNSNPRNGIIYQHRLKHHHPLSSYASMTEFEREEQRLLRAQLSADKWRSRVFDDEVTRAVYYASALEFRSTEKMARYL